MGIKDVLIWLGIFIIGSLIVNFIIYPDSFDSIEGKVDSISTKISNSQTNSIRLVPFEMEEYQTFSGYYKSCANIEYAGESNGVDNMKEMVCREACGKRDMEYSSNDCEKDLLVCYCY